MASQENFEAFLEEFDLSQDVALTLRNGNIQSVKDLASSETSAIRGLVDHPVLMTILPILQQHSTEISIAEDPHKHALDLLHRRADEEMSSTNTPTARQESTFVNDTPSTSRFREDESTEQSNQTVNEHQGLSAEDVREMQEEINRLGSENLQDEGRRFVEGAKIALSVSGGNVVQPNIGGKTIYNKDSIVIDKVELHITNVHPTMKPVDQQTVILSNEKKLSLPQRKVTPTKEAKDESNNAIAKLRAAIRELNPANRDVNLTKFGITSDQLPEVYPEFYSIDFYEGDFIPNDEQYNPKFKPLKFGKSDQKKTIEEITSDFKSQNFISLVGYPGAGKTTLSKRLTRHLALFEDYVALRFLFMNMSNSENDRLTLKQFLLGDVNLKLNENEKTCAFDWIVNHPEKCFLIFDGFDQVDWTIKTNVKINPQFDTSFTPQELVSMLCQGQFLHNCHVLFTSRPHAMLNIPELCRPTDTYFLRDLAFNDMQRLFYALVNDQETADQLWNTLQTNAPELASMCHNPLFLQLYLRASLSSSSNIGNITTTTKVFKAVLQGLKSSGHAVTLDDVTVMQLARIAFKATKRGTVLITLKDLKEEDANLTSAQVQDIVITLLGTDKTCGLLEGDLLMYFTHQTLQEYFAAFYIRRELPLKEFESFLSKNMVSERWSVVMNFLSGILMDQDTQKDEQSDMKTGFPSKFLFRKKDKKVLFLEALKKETTNAAKDAKNIFSDWQKWIMKYMKMPSEVRKQEKMRNKTNKLVKKLKSNADRTLSICNMLCEANTVEVIKNVAACFAAGGMSLHNIRLSQSDVQAVARVIKVTPRLEVLYVAGCAMDSDKFSVLVEAIKEMPGTIDVMDMDSNFLRTVDDIIPILHEIKKELWIGRCFKGGDGNYRYAKREELNLLQEALDNLENTNLKICVEYRFDKDQAHVFLKHKNRVD